MTDAPARSSDGLLIRVASVIGLLSLAGFAYGVAQTLRGPEAKSSLPIPAVQAPMMNLSAVPAASALDAASSNAMIDPGAAKAALKKAKEEEEEADAAEEDQDKPAARAETATQLAAPREASAPAAPKETSPTQHGPF